MPTISNLNPGATLTGDEDIVIVQNGQTLRVKISDLNVGGALKSVALTYFDTVAQMIVATDLEVGMTIATRGYYTAGDGGENLYRVVAAGTGTADGGLYINVTPSTAQAVGLFPGGKIRMSQYGVVDDVDTSVSAKLQSALSIGVPVEIDRDVGYAETVVLPDGFEITHRKGVKIKNMITGLISTSESAIFEANGTNELVGTTIDTMDRNTDRTFQISLTGTSPAVGDMIGLRQVVDSGTPDQHAIVTVVSGGYITIDRTLAVDIPAGAQVYLVTPVTGSLIGGDVEVDFDSATLSPRYGSLAHFRNCKDIVVGGFKTSNLTSRAVHLSRYCDCRVFDIEETKGSTVSSTGNGILVKLVKGNDAVVEDVSAASVQKLVEFSTASNNTVIRPKCVNAASGFVVALETGALASSGNKIHEPYCLGGVPGFWFPASPTSYDNGDVCRDNKVIGGKITNSVVMKNCSVSNDPAVDSYGNELIDVEAESLPGDIFNYANVKVSGGEYITGAGDFAEASVVEARNAVIKTADSTNYRLAKSNSDVKLNSCRLEIGCLYRAVDNSSFEMTGGVLRNLDTTSRGDDGFCYGDSSLRIVGTDMQGQMTTDTRMVYATGVTDVFLRNTNVATIFPDGVFGQSATDLIDLDTDHSLSGITTLVSSVETNFLSLNVFGTALSIPDPIGTVTATTIPEGTVIWDSSVLGLESVFGIWTEGAWATATGGGGGVSETAEFTTDLTITTADETKMRYFTGSVASSVTLEPFATAGWSTDAEIGIYNFGTQPVYLAEGSGVSITPPSGGTLTLNRGMGVILKRVGDTDNWLALGQTYSDVEAAVLTAPVVSVADSYSCTLADVGVYIRATGSAASTLTIPEEASILWPDNTEIHLRVVGSFDYTLTPGTGVTLNAPNSGTLVVGPAMTVTIKRVGVDEWDVLGQTVAA